MPCNTIGARIRLMAVCLFLYSILDGTKRLHQSAINIVPVDTGGVAEEEGNVHIFNNTVAPIDRGLAEQLTVEQATSGYETSIVYLRTLPLRYYVYTDWSLRQGRSILKYPDEKYVFDAFLTNNTWRVTDPALADLFIAPTPLVSYTKKTGEIRSVMLALTRHRIFKQTMGNRHVVFALDGRFFDGSNFTKNITTKRFNQKWAPFFQNATIVSGYASITCRKLSDDGQDHGDWNDLFASIRPMSNQTFSIGLVAGPSLPVIPASYERFERMTYTLFYHTRTAPSDNGSTPYRWAPINVTLPYKASIGYEIAPEQWIQQFTSSKFCLVIRGDTPNSHALLRAVKVGCIPVVVCDYYTLFSPTFKTSLNIEEFSFFLDEKDFLENPQQRLASLQDIPETEIRKKIRALQYAQMITCPDHADSLFIPAFLREAHASFQATYSH